MRRYLARLLAAVFLAGVGTATAQLVSLGTEDLTGQFTTSQQDFANAPDYWTGDASAPGVDYTGPAFGFAGVTEAGVAVAVARVQNNKQSKDRFQVNAVDQDLSLMYSFDITNVATVGSVALNHSTWATGDAQMGLTDHYVILHEDGAAMASGWYAALLHTKTGKTGGNIASSANVADLSWYNFTPVTADGTNILGTIGASVPAATVLSTDHDQAGLYIEQAKPAGTGIAQNNFIFHFAAYELKAELVTDPENLAMSFLNASDITTNEVQVSYNEGAAQTNVNVSSITLVNADPGFSVSPGSLALSNPAPSNETVEVVFDNNTGGLAVNGSATADLQFIWNEVGSATSATSTVPVTATYLGASAGNILAAFYSEPAFKNDGTGDADINFPGVETSVSGNQWNNNSNGSDDTSYGTLLGDAPTYAGCGQVSSWNGWNQYISFTNNTGSNLELDSINFDAARKWGNGSADTMTVTIDGDLTGAPFVSPTFVGFTSDAYVGGSTGDYADFDWDISGLADNVLADGDVITITFTANMGGSGLCLLDNVAVIGKGTLPAIVSRVPRMDQVGWEISGVTGLEEGSSVGQPIDLSYVEGDLMASVVITGVSISNLLDSTGNAVSSGMSAVGAFPIALTTAGETNSAVFELVFDNTVANLEPGVYTEHIVIIEYDEVGGESLTSEFYAYGIRPDVSPTNGVLALFDTELLVPDAGYAGLLGGFISGRHEHAPATPGQGKGSLDGTYGSLLTSRGEGTNDTWCILMNGEDHLQEASLVITNTTTAAIELSALRFDMGRWYEADPNFSLDVSGDVTAANLLTDEPTTMLGWNNHDFDDHDITLTNLADRTLAAGESVTFTWTYEYSGSGNIYLAMFIDNVALIGDVDAYGGWADFSGLDEGVNDDQADNPDGDGKDNLAEYAIGTDPLTADGSTASSWLAEEGGTNWLYYVHAERQDDSGLTYTVGTKGNLQYDPSWDAGEVEEMGRAGGSGLWKTVTNRTDVSSAEEFIGLSVEQN